MEYNHPPTDPSNQHQYNPTVSSSDSLNTHKLCSKLLKEHESLKKRVAGQEETQFAHYQELIKLRHQKKIINPRLQSDEDDSGEVLPDDVPRSSTPNSTPPPIHDQSFIVVSSDDDDEDESSLVLLPNAQDLLPPIILDSSSANEINEKTIELDKSYDYPISAQLRARLIDNSSDSIISPSQDPIFITQAKFKNRSSPMPRIEEENIPPSSSSFNNNSLPDIENPTPNTCDRSREGGDMTALNELQQICTQPDVQKTPVEKKKKKKTNRKLTEFFNREGPIVSK